MMSQLETLLTTDPDARDEKWERAFLQALPSASVVVLNPEPQEGPDGWPYLFVSTEGSKASSEPLVGILEWLKARGIGLVVNPHKATPDFVLSYGMVWNQRERGAFLSEVAAPTASGEIEIRGGQEVLTGPPSESYLPPYARSIVKQFLLDQGIFAPKVLMVSFDRKNYDLSFSLESLKTPPENERSGIAEAIAWFLPAHYSLSIVSEKAIPGFQPL